MTEFARNFYYFKASKAVYAIPNRMFSMLSKAIHMVVFSEGERENPKQLTYREIARRVGSERHPIRQAMRRMVDDGFLQLDHDGVSYMATIPGEIHGQSLAAYVDGFRVSGRVKIVDDSPIEGGTRGTPDRSFRGTRSTPRGVLEVPPLSKQTDTLIRDHQIKSDAPPRARRVPFINPKTCTPNTRDEDEDDAPPDGVDEPKPKGTKFSGPELSHMPSKRPELSPLAPHRKHLAGWAVLGEWARLHVEKLGREDPELIVQSGRNLIRWVVPIQQWVDAWLGGNVAMALEGVRRLFDIAPRSGHPIGLGLYFSPSKGGMLFDVIEGRANRKLEPRRRNDLGATMHQMPEVQDSADGINDRALEDLRKMGEL